MKRTYNIQQGRQKAVQVLGLKELQQRVNELKTRAAGQAVNDVMVECAAILYGQAKSNLQSVKAPHEVLNDLFVYGRNKSVFLSAEKSVTALTGLRKHGTRLKSLGYVEWFASKQASAGRDKTSRTKKKKQSLRMLGTKIGENLGTMWELGTSKMQARPWWRPAIVSSRSPIYQKMLSGLTNLIGGGAA